MLSTDNIDGRQLPMFEDVCGATVGLHRLYSFGLHDCLSRSEAYLYCVARLRRAPARRTEP